MLRAQRARNNTDYMLAPISFKKSLYPYQNSNTHLNILAIVICCIIYALSYTTVVGLSAYNFLVINAYISLKTPLFTVLDYKVAYYFLFDVHESENYKISFEFSLLYCLIPHIFLIFSFIVGIAVRFGVQRLANRNVFWNYVFYYFAYRVPIVTWELVSIPLFITTAHMIEQINPNIEYYPLKCFFLYYNIIIIVLFGYLSYFKANPQINQPQKSWYSYSQNWHFQLFNGFHLGTDPRDKVKRNCKFITYLINILILLFVTVSSSQVPNIVFQLVLFLYYFVVQPFKYEFFNKIFIALQAVTLVFYLYRYII